MNKKINRKGLLFILPITILLAIFLFYPILYSLYLSFTNTQGNTTTFIGLDNYKRLIHDPMFWQALKNTFIILICQVPIMLISALIIATLLNDRKLKCRGFFRTALFLPAVTSLISYTILFKMMFAYDGFINSGLLKLGFISEPVQWLTTPKTALFVLVLAMIWRWMGYNMIFYLSAMQNISPDIYEAAEVDGANKITTFFKITLPSLRPMILFTTIMSTIGTVQLFDEPMNLAQSGTTTGTVGPSNAFMTLSVYIYNLCFKYTPNFGYAATISYVIVIIIVLLSLIQFRIGQEKDEVKQMQKRMKRL